MENLFTPRNMIFLVSAFFFTLNPSKDEVERLLKRLLENPEIALSLQWLMVVVLAFTPLIILMIPAYKAAKKTRKLNQTWRQGSLILLRSFMAILTLYCGMRLLYWLV